MLRLVEYVEDREIGVEDISEQLEIEYDELYEIILESLPPERVKNIKRACALSLLAKRSVGELVAPQLQRLREQRRSHHLRLVG
jgi:hypothetical protein